MKYCPTCETRYDEEILRFCMKDGTPLIEEDEPNFVQALSEPVDDDPDEATVIRRNPVVPPTPEADENFSVPVPRRNERIVVPTVAPRSEPRARVVTPYNPPPRPNTAKVVLLTVIGTLAVLGIGAAGVYLLQNDQESNTNINVNTSMPNLNTNINTNIGIDTNFNFNTNANFNANSITNLNSNLNTNIRTPTPTPRPSPTATPTASPTAEPNQTPTPARSPTPARTPIPTPEPTIIRPGRLPSPRPSPTSPNRLLDGERG